MTQQIKRKIGEEVKVSEFNYELPEELIAQTPIEKRDESRLMVLNKKQQTIEHKTFKNRLLRTRRCFGQKQHQSPTSKIIWKKRNRSQCRIFVTE